MDRMAWIAGAFGAGAGYWAFGIMDGWVWMAGLFGMVAVNGAVGGVMIHRLRKNHPETYESLGSPTAMQTNIVANDRLLIRWIRKGQYKSLGDGNFTLLCRIERIINPFTKAWFFGPLIILAFNLIILAFKLLTS